MSSNTKGAPCHNKCQGALQMDASTGVGLAGAVTPQKWNEAAWSWDNRWKKRAGNVSDDKAESVPPVVEHAQRSSKKAETKGQAPPAAEMGHTAVGMGAEAKKIKEIDLEESDNKGAQAQAGAERAGKMAKRPKTKRQASTPVKKDSRQSGQEPKPTMAREATGTTPS